MRLSLTMSCSSMEATGFSPPGAIAKLAAAYGTSSSGTPSSMASDETWAVGTASVMGACMVLGYTRDSCVRGGSG